MELLHKLLARFSHSSHPLRRQSASCFVDPERRNYAESVKSEVARKFTARELLNEHKQKHFMQNVCWSSGGMLEPKRTGEEVQQQQPYRACLSTFCRSHASTGTGSRRDWIRERLLSSRKLTTRSFSAERLMACGESDSTRLDPLDAKLIFSKSFIN